MLKQCGMYLRFLLVPSEPHHEIDEELQFHLKQQAEANVAAGMTPQEARRQAAISFGGSREHQGRISPTAAKLLYRNRPSGYPLCSPRLRPQPFLLYGHHSDHANAGQLR